LKISAASLQGLIDSGNIKAVRLNGTVAVAESEFDQVVTREQFEHAKHYGIDSETARKWCKRGYIRVLRGEAGRIAGRVRAQPTRAAVQISIVALLL